MRYGGAIHKGIEAFWRGKDFATAMKVAIEECNRLDQSLLTATERTKWSELVNMTPDLLTCYFEKVEFVPMTAVEEEFVLPFNGTHLCGKFDHYMLRNGVLTWWDIKTASEIGTDWKEKYRQEAIRRIQYSLYDFFLTTLHKDVIVAPPKIEVLIKGYGKKPPRYELLELPEVVQWRERFAAQLAHWVREMQHFKREYVQVAPWPMTDTSCVGKYGKCDYIQLCNYGESPKNLEAFIPREEHLECRKKQVTAP